MREKRTKTKSRSILKRMKKSKKKPFSLIEIFICLFLIAIAGSLLGIKGHSIIKKARFDALVLKMKNNFTECRELARLHGEDVIFILQKRDKNLLSSRGFEGGKLKQEEFCNFSFRLEEESKPALFFRFSSTGSVNPLGKITFFTANQDLATTLDLKIFFQWEEKYK
jgi:hypothetical protein